MTFWENVWREVAKEMPQAKTRPRSWAGFFGAAITALVLFAIWFPIRLVHEILKAIDVSEKLDHSAEARRLFAEAYSLSRALPNTVEFAGSVLREVTLAPPLREALFQALRTLYAENMMLDPPPIPSNLDDLDGIRWRDRMRREIGRMKAGTLASMQARCIDAIKAATAAMPPLEADGEITAPLATLTHPGRFVERLARPLDAALFPSFAERYLDNTYRMSGVARVKTPKPPKPDEPHHFDDPSPFLDNTPFAGILATAISVGIPNASRTSHHWIVAGTGAGKTTALQYLIAKDLERCARGECSLVILDSQRQLIASLWGLKLFAPGQPLHGKLCILDAADVEYPIAINLFDMKLDRLRSLSPLDRERLTNSALEMYDFIIGSLLQAEMTSRQSTLFRFVTRALLAIPNSTIHTFHDILKNGVAKYQSNIDRLDVTARQFFAEDFNNNTQFKQTREQVNARLLAVLGNQTFERMFSSPRSKVDFSPRSTRRGK